MSYPSAIESYEESNQELSSYTSYIAVAIKLYKELRVSRAIERLNRLLNLKLLASGAW